ncbi:MAG TPA: hypothetical protein VMZ90_03940 [Vicinamibacterales bacterium]|nr:hypothetical protein [Vicinamibacterales bacterium]
MTLRILAAAMVIAVSAACSKSPTTPETSPVSVVPSANNFEGVWAVTYKVEGCAGFRQCVHFVGTTRTIYLHLAGTAFGYEGVVELEDHVSVSGTSGPDGTLKLTGRRPAAITGDFDTEIEAITFSDPGLSQPSVSGAVRYTTTGPSSANFNGNATTYGPVTAIERKGSLESGSALSGTWTGTVAIRTCERTGWTHCYPLWEDQTYPITLTLLPGAGGVEGMLNLGGSEIPVSGTRNGSGVKLAGVGTHQGSGVTTTYAVESEGLVVDRVGRLTGDVTLVSTYNWHDGRVYTVRYPPLPLYAAARSLR